MEIIYEVITEEMIHSEKKCRKIQAGEVPFSDKPAKAGRHIHVWNLGIRHKERNMVNTKVIRRKAKSRSSTSISRVISICKTQTIKSMEEILKTQKIYISFT